MFDVPDDTEVAVTSKTWSSMSTEDLLAYRNEIDKALKGKLALTLTDLNVEQELMLQFHTLRVFQGNVIDDEDIPPNQRATVANSVGTTLNRLAELQSSVYTSERFKSIEVALIRALSKLPEEAAERFLAEYGQILKSASL